MFAPGCVVSAIPTSLPPARWRARLVLVLLAAVVVPAGAATLRAYPPGEATFYPACWFHALTGMHCPGCGGTRCAGALVHGDLRQAVAFNPLLVAALPLLAVGLAASGYRQWTGRRLPLPRLPGWSIELLFWVIIAFWVLRNVPIYPLTLLAPHAV